MKICDLLEKLFFSILIIAILGSCSKNNSNRINKPADLIQKSTLTEVLTGAYIIESAIYYKNQKGINVGLSTTAYYNALFAKYKITKKQFRESLTYYIETDDNVSVLFLNVINKLMSMQNGTESAQNQ